MIDVLRALMLAALLTLGPGIASAGTLIEFPNLPGQEPAHLLGYIARPDAGLSRLVGEHSAHEPYAAIVVLHGCGGLSSHTTKFADRLASWGYVALTVDSLGPRGLPHACNSGLAGQAFDAYAALHYLAGLEDVEPRSIAVLGNSLGGFSALYAAAGDFGAQYFTERFRAAIAYYPGCGLGPTTMTAPTLILIGEADDWNPAERCRALVAQARADSAPIALTVYPHAYHAFDVEALQPGRRNNSGHWLEYNEAAAKDAEQKVRAFLAAHLTRTQ